MCGSCGCHQPSIPGGAEAAAAPVAAERSAPVNAAPRRELRLEQRLLERNDEQAAANRERFRRAGLQVINLLSSPGSGKTALLEALASHDAGAAAGQAALVGDLATDHDARRLRAAGLTALQINTGQGCHLEAAEVSRALDRLEAEGTPLVGLERLWIENVGNLVCPAGFDLGETLRVVLLACGEGEDKPLKYAPMFHSADLVLISKIDLAEVVGFDAAAARAAIARVAPRAQVLAVSARSGAGLAALATLLRGAGLSPAPAAR